ncbi:MAG: Gfo/Idh/MocA family oxidoreductase, partial [Alphaproteobacteria bacterium]|nr:Gfo/Idh/MocA family oxidoreductase [Alphaproteobacteria bacterium]
AGAYAAHGGFTIVACVEPDAARRRAFMARWGVAWGFSSLADCRRAGLSFDVASVCLPTVAHAAALKALLKMPVRAVFAEKPLTDNVNESSRIVRAYAKARRPLAVNYTRRWDPAMTALRKELAAGRWGRVQNVVVHYGKGLFNCGSHAVDLLGFLWGPLAPRAAMRAVEDYIPADPTVDAVLAGPGDAPVYLVGSDSRRFFDFEIAITADKGRLAIEEQGLKLRIRRVIDSPLFAGYRVLESGRTRATDLGRAMQGAVANLEGCVRRGQVLSSDGQSALAAQETCAGIMALTKRKGRRR